MTGNESDAHEAEAAEQVALRDAEDGGYHRNLGGVRYDDDAIPQRGDL